MRLATFSLLEQVTLHPFGHDRPLRGNTPMSSRKWIRSVSDTAVFVFALRLTLPLPVRSFRPPEASDLTAVAPAHSGVLLSAHALSRNVLVRGEELKKPAVSIVSGAAHDCGDCGRHDGWACVRQDGD